MGKHKLSFCKCEVGVANTWIAGELQAWYVPSHVNDLFYINWSVYLNQKVLFFVICVCWVQH